MDEARCLIVGRVAVLNFVCFMKTSFYVLSAFCGSGMNYQMRALLSAFIIACQETQPHRRRDYQDVERRAYRYCWR